MSVDLSQDQSDEVEPKKASREILQHEIIAGLKVLRASNTRLFISSLAAGLELGFSVFLMGVMLTRAEGQFPQAVVEMLVAAMYAVGFVFVILGRSELFTEQTSLAVLPVLDGEETVGPLVRLWAVVYVGNLIGAAGFAFLTTLAGPALGVIEPEALGTIVGQMVGHAGTTILLSAVLAGWLMGLLSWLVAASRDTISQVVIVGLIASVIGFAGLHHVVAGAVEVLAGAFAGQGVTPGDFGRFLFWTTLGNVLGGGFFVAVIKYGHAIREPRPSR